MGLFNTTKNPEKVAYTEEFDQQYDGGFSGSGRYVPVMLYYGTAVKLREKQ